jgi:hypothetical protein
VRLAYNIFKKAKKTNKKTALPIPFISNKAADLKQHHNQKVN